MRAFVFLLALTTLPSRDLSSVAGAVANLQREYDPTEEKHFPRARFAWIPGDDGYTHFEDLQRPTNGTYTVHSSDIEVYFYSSQSPEITAFQVDTFTGTIEHPAFNPDLPTVFVTHGWSGKNTSSLCRKAREVFFKAETKANLFCAAWPRVSHEFYTLAKAALSELGVILAGFIDKILETYQIDAGSKLTFVGSSLGAHLMGAAGSALKSARPAVIIGLDPASPLFYVDEPDQRLSTDDGELVHILHTNGGFLGFRSAIGHADYYANGGGMAQPGCGSDLVGICAHGRAVDLYGESIISRVFKAHRCDDYEDYVNGLCDDNQVSYFGGLDVDNAARGDFHFDTNGEFPFGKN